MYENDELEQLLQGAAKACEEVMPDDGHKTRFSERLDAIHQVGAGYKRKIWYRAAVVTVLLSISAVLSFQLMQSEPINTTVGLPDEVKKEQFYLETIVETAMSKIEAERNENTQTIIEEAFSQLKLLEEEQKRLEEELKEHYDKRIVKALMDNFQFRIRLLENVMEQIELSKEIESTHDII